MPTGTILLCPGQGAQALGMGRAWREASPLAAEIFERADRLIGDRLGAPLTELCFSGPEAILNRTDVAQAAIYVTSIACSRALFGEAGPVDLVAAAGLSLGEYTALQLAGAFTFEEGLELVLLRGRAMQDAAEAVPSGMVALIGADEAQAAQVCDQAAQGAVLVPANFNAPGQVVISGELEACKRALASATGMGLRASQLAVAGAFHSPIMAPAADRLSRKLEAIPMQRPCCEVLSNVTGRAHDPDPDRIRELLVRQLTSPVLWMQDCAWLVAHHAGPMTELAPGKVLSGLMRRIDRNIQVKSHDEPA